MFFRKNTLKEKKTGQEILKRIFAVYGDPYCGSLRVYAVTVFRGLTYVIRTCQLQQQQQQLSDN